MSNNLSGSIFLKLPILKHILHFPVTYVIGKTFPVFVKFSHSTLPPSQGFENWANFWNIQDQMPLKSWSSLLCATQANGPVVPSKFEAEKSECRMGFEMT